MNEHLSDLLELAGRDDAPLVPPARARADAVRHRSRRRLRSVAAVAVAAAGVALAGDALIGPRPASVVPATSSPGPTATSLPSPSTTSTPARTDDPAPRTSTAPPVTSRSSPPPLEREEAQRVVAGLRFPAEETWQPASDTPVTEVDDPVWVALRCSGTPFGGAPLAWRTVVHALVDVSEERQVVVYEDGEQAAAAFADLRGQMRSCHATPTVETVGEETWTTTTLGGQLDLGEEAFWVAEDTRTTTSGDPSRVGNEQIHTHANLLVLDDNVIVSIWSPAWRADGREEFVRAASTEWEQFRPSYEELRRP